MSLFLSVLNLAVATLTFAAVVKSYKAHNPLARLRWLCLIIVFMLITLAIHIVGDPTTIGDVIRARYLG